MRLKKFQSLFISLLVISLLLTSCGLSKTSITAEEYYNKMGEKGFITQDCTSQYGEGVSKVYVSVTEDYSYQIEFYELTDESTAISSFNNNKETFENSKGSSSTESSSSGKNFHSYTLNSNDMFMHVCQIDNTFIYVNVSSEYKDEVKQILDELGY